LESIKSKLDDYYFLSGKLIGINQLISDENKEALALKIITDEALKPSAIDGEF
jgi:hypothetical protein